LTAGWIADAIITLRTNTVVLNQSDGILFDSDVPTVIENCIVAHNNGMALRALQLDSLDVACSDFYGNAGGDWIPPIAEFVEHDGNFSADPCFCDIDNGEFTLCADSWCLPGNHPWGCDALVGAYDVGCESCDCGGIVPIDDDPDGPGPDDEVPEYSLRLAVSPNPFNPQTTISFSVERNEWAKLSVYELTGSRVAVLGDAIFSPGTHTVTWDGRDSQGRAMPSGSYLIRLETESGVEGRKVSLIR
jgi:hypothetical protein